MRDGKQAESIRNAAEKILEEMGPGVLLTAVCTIDISKRDFGTCQHSLRR